MNRIKIIILLTVLTLLAILGMSERRINTPTITNPEQGLISPPENNPCNTENNSTYQPSEHFSGTRSFEDVKYQVGLGSRIPGSVAHQEVIDWISSELAKNCWDVVVERSVSSKHPVINLTGKRGKGTPWIIIGAHYDSRLIADQDPDQAKRVVPVPGANDGASGVAVLLELSRVLPRDLNKQVWLVFFDVEDQGDIPEWHWIVGSTTYASALTGTPNAVVVIDMIGDRDLNIYKERNSNIQITNSIWDQAAQLGYAGIFIPQFKYSMLDDHTPFLKKGIPAIDIIDFEYPFWHTVSDTADKVSPDSLQKVGQTLLQWLIISK